jgi:hypothetical protein
VDQFLQHIAAARGKLKKGGIPDMLAAARIVLQVRPLRSPPLRSPPLRSPPLRSPPLRSPPLRSPASRRSRAAGGWRAWLRPSQALSAACPALAPAPASCQLPAAS